MSFADYLRAWGPVAPAGDAFLAWLADRGASPGAVGAFRRGTLQGLHASAADDPEPKEWYYFPEASLMGPDAERPLEAGLLVIGTGFDGTLVAVDLRDPGGAVGFLNHERYWRAPDLRAEYVRVAGSLDELAELAHGGKLPWDYAEARRRASAGGG